MSQEVCVKISAHSDHAFARDGRFRNMHQKKPKVIGLLLYNGGSNDKIIITIKLSSIMRGVQRQILILIQSMHTSTAVYSDKNLECTAYCSSMVQ